MFYSFTATTVFLTYFTKMELEMRTSKMLCSIGMTLLVSALTFNVIFQDLTFLLVGLFGGIMGICVGISLISIVEVFYFFTYRFYKIRTTAV